VWGLENVTEPLVCFSKALSVAFRGKYEVENIFWPIVYYRGEMLPNTSDAIIIDDTSDAQTT
jgi:hypothetical protein